MKDILQNSVAFLYYKGTLAASDPPRSERSVWRTSSVGLGFIERTPSVVTEKISILGKGSIVCESSDSRSHDTGGLDSWRRYSGRVHIVLLYSGNGGTVKTNDITRQIYQIRLN